MANGFAQHSWFPKDCMPLPEIAETYFPGVVQVKVSEYLHSIAHPTAPYQRRGMPTVKYVFKRAGLEEVARRFKDESVFVKSTAGNDTYYHPAVGNYRVRKHPRGIKKIWFGKGTSLPQ